MASVRDIDKESFQYRRGGASKNKMEKKGETTMER